jgi:hypothetical protein
MNQLCFEDAIEFDQIMRQQTCSHQFVSYPRIDGEKDEIYYCRACIKCGYQEL